MTKIQKLHTIVHANELKSICQPLEKLNITYFGHGRVDKQGRFFSLCNNPEFAHYYLGKNYENADIHLSDESKLGQYILWDNLELSGESDKLKQDGILFGLNHTFTLIENDSDGMQQYHFSTRINDRSFNQEYFRNLDLLKHFILYFKEQIASSKNFRDAYSEKFAINYNETACFNNKNHIPVNDEDIRKLFLQKIDAAEINDKTIFLTKNIIALRYQSVLTQREMDCLFHTILGKTAKLISAELGISHRTVEEYLASAKKKINVSNKSELIEKVMTDCIFS